MCDPQVVIIEARRQTATVRTGPLGRCRSGVGRYDRPAPTLAG